MSSRRNGRATAAAAKSRFGVLALALVCLLTPLATAFADVDDPQTEPRRVTTVHSRYERNLLGRLNEARSRRGRALLAPSTGLTAAAEVHTRRMVRDGFFDHEAPGEKAFWRRIERFYPSDGYAYWAVSENLAYGSPSLTPGEVVTEWLGSPRHRRSILSPEWREAGLAAVHVAHAPGEFEGEPATVVTLDLGVRRD